VPSFPRAGQKPWPGEARPNEPLPPMATGLEQAARPIHAVREAAALLTFGILMFLWLM
jgi:hypothetical protein